MGLLDIYNDYMKRLQGISVEDDFTGMNYEIYKYLKKIVKVE